MELPIDARRAPFKPKYIVEETSMFAHWFHFGNDPIDGTLQLMDATNDVIIGLTKEQAEAIIRERDNFCESVLRILNGE